MRLRVNPDEDPVDLFRRIAARKRQPEQKKLLLSLKDLVAAAYGAYTSSAPELEAVSCLTVDDEARTALHAAYEATTQLTAHEKYATSQIANRFCYYCRMRRGDTLDHILSQKQGPLFSVFPLNLVPCCQTCNGKKPESYVDRYGERHVFHAFAEDAPDARWLFAEIEPLGEGFVARYFVGMSEIAESETQRRLRVQFESLDLAAEYEFKFADLGWSELRVHTARVKALADLRHTLALKASDYALEYGPNYYLVAGFEAASRASPAALTWALRR